MNFNQQEVQERKLYSGIGAFTLKSFGLSEEELVTKGYSENFAKAFGTKEITIRNGEEEVEGLSVTAIFRNEEFDLELPYSFRIANADRAKGSNKGTYHFISDSLNSAWGRDIAHLQEIAESSSTKEGYANIIKDMLAHNPRVEKVGEEEYVTFLKQIIRTPVRDKDGNSLLPQFVANLKEQSIDFETVANDNTKALKDLVNFLNATEVKGQPKKVDHINLPVVIRTTNSGDQRMNIYTGRGDCFYRSTGNVTAGNISTFKDHVNKQGDYFKDFVIFEPLREVTAQELISGVGTTTQQAPEPQVQDLSDLV